MALKVGIVGLPNVGKSTLFNAVSAAGAEAANYPFATIEPNVGVVPVPDERLDVLGRLASSVRIVPTSVEFLDIAGLVRGASKGEGLGNQFLSHIQGVDAIVHVVRCFVDEEIVHVDGAVDPVRDVEVIATELLLKDLEIVGRRLDRAQRSTKSGAKEAVAERDALAGLSAHLEEGRPARRYPAAGALAAELGLLTAKPLLYAANVGEEDLPEGNAHVDALRKVAAADSALEGGGGSGSAEVVVISAQAEAEIAELPLAERAEFLESLGLERSGLDRLVTAAYELLGLLTFFTAGPKEARAWTVRAGATAPQAAGKIHSDMERGFIRAEVITYDDYVACGSEAKAREAGKLRIEGRDYVVADGDVLHVRFNV